jgi:DNA-binding NarL/FixJ family response regulator
VNVLLVDDHAIVRAGLRARLERAGVIVVAEAASGAAALVLARAHRPDVVLVDLTMPGTDVGALVRSLLGMGARVVLLVTLEPREEIARVARAGVCGVVPKDDPGMLLEALDDEVDVAGERS